MKKSLIALAVMAAAGAASAQSSVTLFGVVDATLAYGRASGAGGSSLTQLTNSGYNSSRLGFRGTEDLGGGMSASFWLEAGISNDDGRAGGGIPAGNQGITAAANTGLNFNRRSTVSLGGTWGEIRLGRDYTPSFWNLTIFDPFGTNGVGTTMTLVGPAGGNGVGANALVPFGQGTSGVLVRASNSIGYFLPANLGGFYGQVQYALGENLNNGAATEDDGRSFGARLGFGQGPFNIAGSWQRTTFATTATAGDFTTWSLAGQWDFGMAKLMGQFVRDERESLVNTDGRGWLVGTLVPVGAGEIRASYSEYRIDAGAGADPRSRKLALGYVHNLSKRTALYATVARVKNTNGAAVALNGSTYGAGVVNASSTGYDLGIRHSF
ncbi:MAG: putative outer rane porin protein precursor [Ramlibacter sp.]|jgi:predicted porin|nr:putative outer rane porin protein precursor [Ramlibacter sp.]